jgi:Mlc titration factor MtfA (ptsG expression regulator)
VFGTLRKWQRRRLNKLPFPAAWLGILTERVPYCHLLSPDEQTELRKLIRVFLAEKNFEGCGGLEMTEEIRVTIAAQACILLLNRGAIILSWDEVRRDSREFQDGHNVTLHEFDHQLDQQDGTFDQAPLLETRSHYRSWALVLMKEYRALAQAAELGQETFIDQYGATDPAEFFAVITEAFFERPKALKEKHPELYAELQKFFHQDPLARLEEAWRHNPTGP